jgi:two-component system alkaline phosphatase synthesis response regulator PhoP
MIRRVLLVEDEESLVLTVRDRLVNEGYGVEVAMDGETAVETARRGMFDVILLDVALPRKNGFDVCRDLRNHSVQTPVLMLTARGQIIDRILGLKLGADDYLTKPFDMAE